MICFVEKSSIKFPENSLLKTWKCKFSTDTIFSSRYESSFGGDLICPTVLSVWRVATKTGNFPENISMHLPKSPNSR